MKSSTGKMIDVIDYDILHKLEDALIMSEIDENGVNPSETLAGTTFRKIRKEGYKQGVYERGHSSILKGGPYTETIMKLFPGVNLVSYRQEAVIKKVIENKGQLFESALKALYECNDDEGAFKDLVSIIGGNFDILGFLFFLKDCNKYFPIRSRLFDERFRILGIESNLAGNCTWGKYQEYNETIRALQKDLAANVNKDITDLDAHSFLWILPRIKDYVDNGIQIVEHEKFGTGTVVDFRDNYIVVKFGKEEKLFDKDWAFQKGHLKYVKVNNKMSDGDDTSRVKNFLSDDNTTNKYIVIHSKLPYNEYAKDYLSSPYHDKNGKSLYYWNTLSDLKPNDILFNYAEGCIRAISIVTSDCYEVDFSEINGESEEWGKKRRRVDYELSALEEPIDISDYRDEIIKYRREKHSAFDKNGKANQGYVYELEPEIANLFERIAIRKESLSKKGLEVAKALLTLIANGQHIVTYSELSDMTESKPSPYYEMNGILDKINRICDDLELPYISAMVVNKSTGLPGEGFRNLCVDELGYDSEMSLEEIYESELEMIQTCDEWDVLAETLGFEMPVNTYDQSDEYDPVEMQSINDLIQGDDTSEKPEWTGEKNIQAMTNSPHTGNEIPKRDSKRAADALRRADYMCEYNYSDRTFLRKNGRPYTEPHHLIPISKYKDFEYSVDVMENIVSLCSNCHNLLHYGRLEDKKPILEKLYSERKDALASCGLELTLEQLEQYYK